ncbi:hypothetical protein BY996DRAFT_4575627 [Phakopsora pachyrhizi]|uniref:Ubiquitin-activating enzyme E1-like n=1 Tax=Phakopsora pachyrhizi TaxID=170000 RepID=A0AAV0BTC2_PHAPC|nr:hypothetical protein BY996DRAFT_4575627 [Phakopsora pachyrhizi]CAH7689653.1 hypothetical protein PPACK8108_LOCUS24782 [Phakopsora pachyrhizi]
MELENSLEDLRYKHLRTNFGDQTCLKILHSSVLVVGAGGIGCELLKNLVCTGFGNITIVDLDTIDTSNLNRQFLFQKRHVKKPKAIVARETASAFNPRVIINASQANIMDSEFDQAYFKRFDLVMNALDNVTARRHVNKMCIINGVPLIESGTAGYYGQVQPIQRGKTECYDCSPKAVPKTYPVCTIRSTPSTPIHCIVWAKGYLFPQLFGPEDENEGADLDQAIQNGENSTEIENLRQEVKQMKQIRSKLNTPEMSKLIFTKVFEEDINRLLKMEDMWKSRKAPTPLSYDLLSDSDGTESGKSEKLKIPDQSLLKDQKTLSLKDSFKLFNSSLLALANRVASDPDKEPLSWDKDDDDALDFVTAAANLRASVFDIQTKTRFEVKEMAGNIIPAIPTTNSIISALIVSQAIQVLSQGLSGPPKLPIKPCGIWLNKTQERVMFSSDFDLPNPSCEVCQVVYVNIKVKRSTKIIEFIKKVLEGRIYQEEEDYEKVTVQEGDRLLFDVDLLENGEKSFEEVGLIDDHREKVLRVTEEDEVYVPLIFTISKSRPEDTEENIIVEGFPETIPKRPKPIKSLEENEQAKGSGHDSDIEFQENSVDHRGVVSQDPKNKAQQEILTNNKRERELNEVEVINEKRNVNKKVNIDEKKKGDLEERSSKRARVSNGVSGSEKDGNSYESAITIS